MKIISFAFSRCQQCIKRQALRQGWPGTGTLTAVRTGKTVPVVVNRSKRTTTCTSPFKCPPHERKCSGSHYFCAFTKCTHSRPTPCKYSPLTWRSSEISNVSRHDGECAHIALILDIAAVLRIYIHIYVYVCSVCACVLVGAAECLGQYYLHYFIVAAVES